MNGPDARPSQSVFDDVVDADGPLLAVGLLPSWLAPMLAAVRDAESPPNCRLLLGAADASRLGERFLTDARVAAGIEDGTITARVLEGTPPDRLVVGDDRATLFVSLAESLETITAVDDRIVDAFRAKYDEFWAAGTGYDPRAPGWGRLLQRAEAELSAAFAAAYAEAVRSGRPLRWSDEPDPLGVALLVAGRQGAMLHDLSGWADDVCLASPSSCSRTKQRLVDADLLDTERVPQGVGRPRQRLVAGDAIADVPLGDVVPVAQSELEN